MTGPLSGAGAHQRCPTPGNDPDSPVEACSPLDVSELYLRHSPGLVRQLTRATGCREAARDLMQETFARLVRISPAGQARIDHPEAFLRRISVNLLRDWGRSKASANRACATIGVAGEPLHDQVAALESRETLRRLEQAMARLKPKTRDIFLAHRLEGLSYAEIAGRTGLSIKGVEKQMSKAIAKIDRMLDRS